jgi:hypothetical protein
VFVFMMALMYHFPAKETSRPNRFAMIPITVSDLGIKAISDKMRVIVCSDGNLDTFEEIMEPTTKRDMPYLIQPKMLLKWLY